MFAKNTKMNSDPRQWNPPILVGVVGPGMNVQGIREITEAEQAKIEEHKKLAVKARNRFKLFAILRRNYDEWWNYTRSLLAPTDSLTQDEMVELDRLLLNYLSAAKSLLDHFRQHWMQSYRRTENEADFKNYIDKLENESWAFAFFQDLRNFTQHCGLPVGNYSRNANRNSVTLRIEADSVWLTDHFKDWKKSKLEPTRGKIDLIELVQEYQIRLTQDFGNFIAGAFAPSLLDAHYFFWGLTQEVAQANPAAEPRVLTGLIIDGSSYSFQFASYPKDLLGSLGITMRKNTNERQT